jgi:lipopolysaccharide export system permease protein
VIFGGLLNRTVFFELLRVFALTLIGVTGLFLIGLVVQQANNLGLSMLQTLEAIPLLVPYTLPYTIPATTLFASCVVYGRIAHDNEAVALKAAGVNLHTILRPALLLGLITAGTTFALAHTFIPRSQAALQKKLLKDPEELLYNLLKRDRTFKAGNFPYVIHVRDVIGRRLVDVVLKRKQMRVDGNGREVPTGEYDFVVRAREARLRVVLPDADQPGIQPMLFIEPDRWVGGDGTTQISTDANRPIGVQLPDMFSPKEMKNRASNLLWDELPARADEFRSNLNRLKDDLNTHEQVLAITTDPALRVKLQGHIRSIQFQMEEQTRMMRIMENEYYMRPALALGCLVFALIGCPVGIRANRADYLSSFVVCFLPTMAAYYPLLLAGSNMGRDGKIPLPIGVFSADAIGGLMAIVLTWKLIRR